MNTTAPASSSAPSPSVVTALLALMEGPLADAHFELVDIDASGLGATGATVRVLVELAVSHPVGGRIDLDQVSAATRIVDELLEGDTALRLLPDRYTLEVSSPGLERPLRTPGHFRRAIGSSVTVKTKPGTPGERRVEGRLADASIDADDPSNGIRVGDRSIAYADIEKARIVINWGPPPKPGAGSPRKPHPMAVKAAAQAAALVAGNDNDGHAATGLGEEAFDVDGSDDDDADGDDHFDHIDHDEFDEFDDDDFDDDAADDADDDDAEDNDDDEFDDDDLAADEHDDGAPDLPRTNPHEPAPIGDAR